MGSHTAAHFAVGSYMTCHTCKDSVTLNLMDIILRNQQPEPWEEVSKIPWDEPEFSARMLREHLTQDHDAASRRAAVIDDQVAWIHQTLLKGKASNILDLGCGPGLYCLGLAGQGHDCTGIDFGPASVDYARSTARSQDLNIDFVLGDLRSTDFGEGRDLIMLIFGEFNTFQRSDALDILNRSRDALAPDGRLIVEAHTLESIREKSQSPRTWASVEYGLFSDQPYLRLDDAYWHENTKTSVERHYVVDASSGEVNLYGTTMQAYSQDEYVELLREAGYSSIEWRSDWPNVHEGELALVVARP